MAADRIAVVREVRKSWKKNRMKAFGVKSLNIVGSRLTSEDGCFPVFDFGKGLRGMLDLRPIEGLRRAQVPG